MFTKRLDCKCFDFCQLGCEVSFGFVVHMKARLKNQPNKDIKLELISFLTTLVAKPFARNALKKSPFKLDSNSLASGPCALAQP